MKKLLMVFVCAGFAAHASDSAATQVIGFSPDGKYAAVEQYGVHDGSGAAYSQIAFLNVDNNTFAVAPVSVNENPDTANSDVAGVRKQAAKAAANTLKDLGITVLSGLQIRKVGENPVTGLAFTDAKQSLNIRSRGAFWSAKSELGHCDLKLTETGTGVQDDFGTETQKLKLGMTCDSNSNALNGGAAHSEKVLQNDDHLPASRSGAIKYEIDSAYVYDSSISNEDNSFDFTKAKLLVLVRYYEQGFEGSDLRFIPVSSTF